MEDRKQSVVVRMREFLAARPRLRLAGGLVAVAVLVLLLAPNPDKPGVHQTGHPVAPSWGGANGEASPREGDRVGENNVKEMASLPAPLGIAPEFYKQNPNLGGVAGAMSEPRIAYSAELSMVTKEFAHSRASLEEILERHRGYTARLRMVGQPSGSVLTALLRVPSSEYRSALSELKGVGVLEHEEEAADEITLRHSELEARLVNAQNEERRIQQLLQNHSDKESSLDTLQRQVALLHSEIERMQSERYSADSRVTFANVSFSLREERTPPAETVGGKLRAAAVGGLSDAFDSISFFLLLLAGRGPLLVLWVVLLYFPARYCWRRRSQWAFSTAETPKNS